MGRGSLKITLEVRECAIRQNADGSLAAAGSGK
jgi:hypothetical protein